MPFISLFFYFNWWEKNSLHHLNSCCSDSLSFVHTRFVCFVICISDAYLHVIDSLNWAERLFAHSTAQQQQQISNLPNSMQSQLDKFNGKSTQQFMCVKLLSRLRFVYGFVVVAVVVFAFIYLLLSIVCSCLVNICW